MPEMSSSKYNLKWQDYRDTVSSSFGSLRTDTELCDIRLVSEDEEQVLAHKVVLSTCSKFFKTLLCKLSGPNAVAFLGGVNTRHLHYVLDYIYLGEVNIAHEDVDCFLEQAKKFKLQGFESQKGSENIQGSLLRPKEEVVENVVEDISTTSQVAMGDDIADDDTGGIHPDPESLGTEKENRAINEEEHQSTMTNLGDESPTPATQNTESLHEVDQQEKISLKTENDDEETFDLDEDFEDLLADDDTVVEDVESNNDEDSSIKEKHFKTIPVKGQIQWEEKISNFIQAKLKKSETSKKIKLKYKKFDMSNVRILKDDKLVSQKDLDSLLDNLVVKKDNMFQCTECDHKQPHKSSLKYHAETHIKQLSVICSICSHSCPTRSALRNHINVKHKSSN